MATVLEECRHETTLDDWYRPEPSLDWRTKRTRGMLYGRRLHLGRLFGRREGNKERHPRVNELEQAEQLFAELANNWRKETAHVSSTTQIVTNPHYQQIIGMGQTAVPMILRELEHSTDHWSWALVSITRENPVQKRDAGNLKLMRAAWLRWGKERGLLG